MQANVYIDGFNLYYGCLKGTLYKWLDLEKLFDQLMGDNFSIKRIKFFTARVSGTADDPDKPHRQDAYLAALKAYNPRVETVFGHYLHNNVRMPLSFPSTTQTSALVIKTEEKGSDVNLAVELLNDAWLDDYYWAIVVSNDSDLSRSLMLAKRHRHKKICLINPGNRNTSRQLSAFADTQKKIRDGILRISQLPEIIPGTTIKKPRDWY